MKQGRRPDPKHLKVLRGSRRVNYNEPPAKPGRPAMPRGMPADFQREWRRLADLTESLGVLTAADGPALTMAALHLAVALAAGRALLEDGLEAVDERGLPRKNPLNQIFREHSLAFRAYASLFGLSPADRQRLTVEAASDADPLAAFLRREE